MSSRDRSRVPAPNDVPPHREPRRMGDGRNGGFAGPGEATMSRAEKFEDEKRRIIQSCFSKKDSDGSRMYTFLCTFTVALQFACWSRLRRLRREFGGYLQSAAFVYL
jgi:hypothetical protein